MIGQRDLKNDHWAPNYNRSLSSLPKMSFGHLARWKHHESHDIHVVDEYLLTSFRWIFIEIAAVSNAIFFSYF